MTTATKLRRDPRAPWTRDEERQLRDLYQSGMELEEIGRRFGVSASTIARRAQQLGLRMRHGRDPRPEPRMPPTLDRLLQVYLATTPGTFAARELSDRLRREWAKPSFTG